MKSFQKHSFITNHFNTHKTDSGNNVTKKKGTSLLEQGKPEKMLGEKSGHTERQLWKNVEHNQLSVKHFSNTYPDTDTTWNSNRCSLELWMWLLLFHLPTTLGWGSGEGTKNYRNELQEHSLKLEINIIGFLYSQQESHTDPKSNTEWTPLLHRATDRINFGRQVTEFLVTPGFANQEYDLKQILNRKNVLYTPVHSKAKPFFWNRHLRTAQLWEEMPLGKIFNCTDD